MNGTIELPALRRAADLLPATLDDQDRSIEVVWSTGARVRRQPFFGEPFDEELSMDPSSVRLERLNAGAPLLKAADDAPKVKLRKAVKFGMIGIKGTVQEKFELIKKLGFQGVEVDSPSDLNKQEALKASDATGIKIHGTVDSVHWKDTLSHPDEAVRARERLQFADPAFASGPRTIAGETPAGSQSQISLSE